MVPFYRVYKGYKMEYAEGLLREGQTASSVSERVGYTQPIKFNKMFERFYGMGHPLLITANFRLAILFASLLSTL